jgi:hypothetical protein
MKKNPYDYYLKNLEKDLKLIELEKKDILVKITKNIKLINEELTKLKIVVTEEGFPSEKEEIHFFKNIKPQIAAKLVFNSKLFEIEIKHKKGSIEVQKTYLDKEIALLQKYFFENLEMYRYYRTQQTDSDNLYFLRINKDIGLGKKDIPTSADENFTTSQDKTFTNFIANTLLIDYLQLKMEAIENKSRNQAVKATSLKSNLFWTSHKVDLVELIYSLHSSKVLNNGKTEIKELASFFEQAFNIELDSLYRTYIELRGRKKNPTKFLDFLKKSLIKRMEESDT